MKVSDSSPSTTSRSASSIKVSILNTQYTIKQTDNLSEADIRTLAEFVDRMMQQFRQKGHDTISVATMAALNIAAQMYGEQRRCAETIRHLTQIIDEAMDSGAVPDTQPAETAEPTSNP
ncbi:MAG: cell division protein ZapA [Candidatus Poribacteria bacterium]|nr:cell division protein ZapA [Candidatus Poribacteria bacterium]